MIYRLEPYFSVAAIFPANKNELAVAERTIGALQMNNSFAIVSLRGKGGHDRLWEKCEKLEETVSKNIISSMRLHKV